MWTMFFDRRVFRFSSFGKRGNISYNVPSVLFIWSLKEYRKVLRALWADESQALMWRESHTDGSASPACQRAASMCAVIHLK